MTEFELIAKYFARSTPSALIGNGDDAAVVAPREGHAFVITTDTLIESRHYLPTLDPMKLGRRLAHVNLSDLAAMGATPRFATLSLTLPHIDETWVDRFAQGLWSALDAHSVELIGGNTTRGHTSLSMTAIGEVSVVSGRAMALTRAGARAGDELWVSGSMGDAGWALYCMTGVIAAEATRQQIDAYEMPTARIRLGQALQNLATSCIDVSDGLLSEANHLAQASDVAFEIDFSQIPSTLKPMLTDPKLSAQATHCLLATGDAYELLFTVPRQRHEEVATLLRTHELAGDCIGRAVPVSPEDSVSRVRVLDASGHAMGAPLSGWDHFA